MLGHLLMFYFLSHNCNSFDKISYAIPCAADGAMFLSLKNFNCFTSGNWKSWTCIFGFRWETKDQLTGAIILLNLGLHVLVITTCLFGWLLMVKAYVWFLITSAFFCPISGFYVLFKSIMIYFDSIQYCKLLEQYG